VKIHAQTTRTADVKNVWRYISASSYAFKAWCWIKYRDNFTFYISREEGSLALIRFGSGSERKSTSGPRLLLSRTTSLRFKDVFAGGIFGGHTLGHFKSIIVVQYAMF
jgi:hypothetical protein